MLGLSNTLSFSLLLYVNGSSKALFLTFSVALTAE
jgi:hypothetical protein